MVSGVSGEAGDGPHVDDDKRWQERRGEERTTCCTEARQTGPCPQGESQSPVISPLSHQPGVSQFPLLQISRSLMPVLVYVIIPA